MLDSKNKIETLDTLHGARTQIRTGAFESICRILQKGCYGSTLLVLLTTLCFWVSDFSEKSENNDSSALGFQLITGSRVFVLASKTSREFSHTSTHMPNLCQRLSAILRVLKNIHFQTPPTVFIKSSPNLILLDYLLQNLCNRCSHIFNEKKSILSFYLFSSLMKQNLVFVINTMLWRFQFWHRSYWSRNSKYIFVEASECFQNSTVLFVSWYQCQCFLCVFKFLLLYLKSCFVSAFFCNLVVFEELLLLLLFS